MRNLIFVFTVIFSLTGFVGFSYAQDVDGEALLEQYLPDDVTLETATEAQILQAMNNAVVANANNQTALTAISQAATSSPRVTNKASPAAAARTVINGVRSVATNNPASHTPTTEVIEAQLAADVVNHIIRNSSLTATDVTIMLAELVQSLSQSVDDVVFITNLAVRIQDTAAEALSDQTGEVCTVSNGTTTCVPA